MRLYFPVDLTGNLIMIEKLVLGEIQTGDLPIFNPDALTSAPSVSIKESDHCQFQVPTLTDNKFVRKMNAYRLQYVK